jgi:hypothetical protein
MGEFRIDIQGVGGHGCQRQLKNGAEVKDCGDPNCPDCLTRRFVKELKKRNFFGYQQTYAKLVHWPGSQNQVTDDLLTGVRQGNFDDGNYSSR